MDVQALIQQILQQLASTGEDKLTAKEFFENAARDATRASILCASSRPKDLGLWLASETFVYGMKSEVEKGLPGVR